MSNRFADLASRLRESKDDLGDDEFEALCCDESETLLSALDLAASLERGEDDELVKRLKEAAATQQRDGDWFILADDLTAAATRLGERTGPLKDIADERSRQVTQEGWTPEHDDEHSDGSLAKAAAAYAYHGSLDDVARDTRQRTIGSDYGGAPLGWPESWATHWWKPKDRRRDLVRAAALIVAEIERLDRATLTPKDKP